MEVLYFPGCVPSYDPRAIQVAKATARLMQMAGVTFGIMGSKEMCCGETARRVGKRDLFVRLAEHNTRLFEESGASKIVVSSPHCLHAFKNEYPLAGLNVEVLHISQFLLELIAMGSLKVHEVVPHRVTYQDPCYLGRYNNVYDEPREVLRSIPGVELTEMSHHGPGSVCCGGGGGRMWIETRKGERLADIRIEQAKATGADTLVTSCPFCLSMLEDALLTSSAADSMVAKDISELLYEAIDTDTALASRGLPA